MKFYYLIFAIILTSTITFVSCSSESDPDMEIIDDKDDDEKETNDDTSTDDDNLDDAPSYSLKTYDDQDLNSSTYKDKVLVIFFFGNSCPPCIGVGPDIEEKINDVYKDNEKFAIIGIDQWDGNASSVERFQERTNVSFPLGLEGSDVAKDFGTTYDRLVVVNENNKIAYKGTSIAANNLDDVIALIDTLLK